MSGRSRTYGTRGVQRYQMGNHLDSACLELDSTAAIISYEEYYPFGSSSYRSGRNSAETSLKRYRYVGKERDDETGLYYYGARYYASWLARFVSVDPLKDDYPHLTPFQYASNDPIGDIDIDGLEGVKTIPRRSIKIDPILKRGLGQDPGGITPGYGTPPRLPQGIRYATDQYGNTTAYYPPISRASTQPLTPNSTPLSKEEYKSITPTTIGQPGVATTFEPYKNYLQQFNKNLAQQSRSNVSGNIDRALVLSSKNSLIAIYGSAKGEEEFERQTLDYLERKIEQGEALEGWEKEEYTKLLAKVHGEYFEVNLTGSDENFLQFTIENKIDNIEIYAYIKREGDHAIVNVDLIPESVLTGQRGLEEAFSSLKGLFKKAIINLRSQLEAQLRSQGFNTAEFRGNRETGPKTGTVQSSGIIDLNR